MPINDSAQHVVRTSAQWDERAVEFWVVPRGCLCVELTPDHKTKIKIGEGNKFYSQLPYITSEGDLANYYTKTEIDNLLANLNRMAIQSTEEYDSKNDLPLTGNKLGDVRFVKSASPSIKTDPDVYVWNNTKWIYVGYDFSQIDLSDYVKKEEFEPVVEKVNEMYEIKHTHDNKEILDRVEVAFTVVDKNKLDSLENYDDTEVKNRLTNVENKAHVHNNMQILNMTTAAFTIPDKNKLDSLRNYDVFRGTNGILPGTIGLVPAPQPADVGKVLSANGGWVDVDVAPFTGATATTDGESGLVPAPLAGEQSYYLRGDGVWANVRQEAEQYGAGAGINIIQGEASGDKFPINIASNDNYIEEYIIYGTEAGVGDYDPATHKFVIPIAINAKDRETIRSYIYLDDPLGQGEYVIFSEQKAVKYRENILLRSGYEAGKFIADGGTVYSGDVDEHGEPISYITGEIGLIYDDRYILQGLTYDEHENSQHVFCHWIRMNDIIGQTVTYSTSPMAVPSSIWGPSNSHRINVTVLGYEDNLYKARLYHMLGSATDFPATLARITIYAGVINTLDVETTNKPDQIYVRAHVNTDPDAPPVPETWIIENTGVIDVEQDETNRNKLTFKYKDTEKVITINDAGDIYNAGPGIEIEHESETYLFAESIHLMPGDIIDTGVTPSGTQDFGAEFGFNSPSFNSFILICYDGYEGSFSFNPNSSSAGDVARMWIYNGYEDWIDLFGESLSTNTDYEFKCTWGHNMSMQQLPSGQVYSESTAYYPIDHQTVKLGYDSSETIFYYIKLYDGAELVGDFVPAVRQSDNRTGLFDRVTNTFHTNTGTVMSVGNLTGGSYVDVFPGYDISAKIGDGLQFDNNDAIKVKLGTGLQFDASGAIETTGGGGGSYTAGNGIDITNDDISVKIGEGLSFDNSGTINADRMIGATPLTDGARGTVPAPLIGDEGKYLRGDGTWAVIAAATNYVEGDAIEFTHPGMTDLGFDFDAFVSRFTPPNNGIISVDSVNKSFTLTATGPDAYTNPWLFGVYTIPVVGGRKYRLTWNSNAPNVDGSVFAFENADTSHMHSVNQATQNYLEFTADTTSNVNFRFGVANSGDTIRYSNIKFYEVDNADPDTNIINVKYGSGLSLDSSNRLQANTMTGADGTNAGAAGIVPTPTATDNTKFLKGDGTWSDTPTYTLPIASSNTLGGIKVGNNLTIDANGVLSAIGGGGGGGSYTAGDGIDIEPTLVAKGFSYAGFINSVSGNGRGTLTKNNDNSFTMTATGDDFFTNPFNLDQGISGVYIFSPVEGEKTYRLTWDSSDRTVSGRVFIFENGRSQPLHYVDQSVDEYLEFTTASGTSSLSFRFGVENTGDTLTYSNIELYEVVSGSSIISAKLGEGLSFDNNGAIQTDVMTGADGTNAGTSGTVPAPTATDNTKFLKGDGTWADVPSAYVLPTASASTLGGVKVGDNLSIDANGVLSADDSDSYAAGEGIRFSAGPSITTMTRIKWRILETRSAVIDTSNDDTVQIGEIEFYDENDTLLTFSAISGQFVNTSLTPTYNTDNYVKTPDKLIDGDLADKCCCTNFTEATRGIEFIFELSTSMSPQDFKNYTWYTANDNSNCDPVTWQMYISDDGTHWVLVDERTRETIPTAREVSTELYAITKPDANAQAINVKYGAGLSLDENGYLIATGTQLTAGQGIEIQNSTISDKLGVGLTYDNNDAITLDEATELVLNCDYSVS